MVRAFVRGCLAAGALAIPALASAQTPIQKSSGSTGYVQPIFGSSKNTQADVNAAQGMLSRAVKLGSQSSLEGLFYPLTGLVDILVQNIDDGKKPADPKGNEPKGPGNEPKDPKAQGNDAKGLKEDLLKARDEINRIFKSQADQIQLIGGLNVGAAGPTTNEYFIATGRTGLGLTQVPPQLRNKYGLSSDMALYVHTVFPGTPAAKAGFKVGDVLVELDGRAVPSDYSRFLDKVMRFVKNDVDLTAKVMRDNNTAPVTLTGMRITDQRTVPVVPNETNLTPQQLIQEVPGIQRELPNTVNVPAYRIIRNGGTTEIIPLTPTPRK